MSSGKPGFEACVEVLYSSHACFYAFYAHVLESGVIIAGRKRRSRSYEHHRCYENERQLGMSFQVIDS